MPEICQPCCARQTRCPAPQTRESRCVGCTAPEVRCRSQSLRSRAPSTVCACFASDSWKMTTYQVFSMFPRIPCRCLTPHILPSKTCRMLLCTSLAHDKAASQQYVSIDVVLPTRVQALEEWCQRIVWTSRERRGTSSVVSAGLCLGFRGLTGPSSLWACTVVPVGSLPVCPVLGLHAAGGSSPSGQHPGGSEACS